MTHAEALKAVRGFGAAGRVRLSDHLVFGRSYRGVSIADACCALANATSARFNRVGERGEDTWRVEGKDLDGDDLTLICVIDNGVLVITAF